MDRFRDIDYVVQRASLMALFERFRPILIIPERNSMGEPVVEQLQQDKLPVQPFYTNETKRIAIEALANAFERTDIQILNDETLIAELQAYQTERLPSGMFRYAAPEGMHDDTVMALAMASSGTSPVSYKPEDIFVSELQTKVAPW